MYSKKKILNVWDNNGNPIEKLFSIFLKKKARLLLTKNGLF